MSESERLNEQESFDLLARIFPAGLRSADLLNALCLEGWQNSSLKALFEDAPETSREEADVAKLGHLIGSCLWDILSDNHDLVLADGRVAHLGSFRAAAGVISDFFAVRFGDGFQVG